MCDSRPAGRGPRAAGAEALRSVPVQESDEDLGLLGPHRAGAGIRANHHEVIQNRAGCLCCEGGISHPHQPLRRQRERAFHVHLQHTPGAPCS